MLSAPHQPPSRTPRHTPLPASEMGKAWCVWPQSVPPHPSGSPGPHVLPTFIVHPMFYTSCYVSGASSSHQHPCGPQYTLFSLPSLLIPLSTILWPRRGDFRNFLPLFHLIFLLRQPTPWLRFKSRRTSLISRLWKTFWSECTGSVFEMLNDFWMGWRH